MLCLYYSLSVDEMQVQSACAILSARNMTHTNSKQRTYNRNRTKDRPVMISRKGREKVYESDGVFFGKLVLYLLLGALWLRFGEPVVVGGVPVIGAPVGLLVGLLLVNVFEKYQYNRKIWYVVLVITAIVGAFLPIGIWL